MDSAEAFYYIAPLQKHSHLPTSSADVVLPHKPQQNNLVPYSFVMLH